MNKITNTINVKFKTFVFFTICFLFFTVSLLIAQETWVQTYTPFGEGDYHVEDIVVCADGGYAINGYYYYYDIGWEERWGFLMKTDIDGNMLWADKDTVSFMWENESYALVETSEGDLISIGYSYGEGYLLKRDSLGNRLWSIPYNDFGANSMSNTNDGNIILGGVVNSEIALRKIDNEGNTLWTNSHNCGYTTIATSIYQSSNNGFLLTGYTSGNGFDIIVMKTDENGDSLWTRTYDAFGDYDQGNCVIENSNGDILVCGYVSIPEPYHSEGFLWLLDTDGTTYWTQHTELDVGYGHVSLLHLIDNTDIAYCHSSTGGKIYKFDTEYNIIWESPLPQWISLGDRGFQKIQDGLICAGKEHWGDYISLVKTDENGQYTSINDHEISSTYNSFFQCYPNPFNPTINFEIKADNLNNLQIEIFNIKGQKIKTIPIVERNVSWNANNNASGIYFCKLINIETDKILSVNKVTLLK